MASHCRHRYRIVNKNPATAGLSYDPALSIVHYSQAEPQLRYPVNRIPLQPDVPRILQERRILESQGQLARKEFMLHDRYKWPTINPPHIGQLPPSGMAESQMHAPNASAMAAVGRHPQYYPQNQYAQFGPSPAKRPRQALQYSHPGAGGPAMHSSLNVGTDPGQDEEEYAAYGDLLDHLTPAEISRMRFVQHHVWMEELISSPYATNQIEPVDLGLGLMGELAELTNGVVDAAILNPPEDGPLGAPNSHRIKKVTASQLSEFERRVKKYSRDGAAELDRHAKEHAGRLASIKRSKAYLVAERKLRQEQTDEGGGQGEHSLPGIGSLCHIINRYRFSARS